MLVAKFANLSHLPFAGGYYYYFAAGAVFAILKSRSDKLAISSVLVCLVLCIGFSAGKAPALSADKGVSYSEIVIGGIVVAQFLFFIVLNSSWGSPLVLPWSRLAGGLTYPIYLIHAHFGYMFLSRFGTDETRFQAYATVILIVLGLAFLIHTYIEKRFSKFWHRFFWIVLGSPIDALNTRLRRLVFDRQR